MKALVACIALCTVSAEDLEAESAGWSYAPGEGVSFNEREVVSAEFSVSWDSKYLTYGLVDDTDPTIIPGASLTFLDWLNVGISAIYNTTKYGQNVYYNRSWRWMELDPQVGVVHSFTPDDFEWLPTTVDLSVAYLYEEHPWSLNGPNCPPEREVDYDTQFVTLVAGLPDLWLEPVFTYQQDTMRDSGSYLNLELGHTFALIDGDREGDGPVLSLKPSIWQGWGDHRRVRGYLSTESGEGLNRAGLMDSRIQLAAEWRISACLSLSGYVAYSDYIFDRHTREAARRYEPTGKYDDSFNFICGLRLAVSF